MRVRDLGGVWKLHCEKGSFRFGGVSILPGCEVVGRNQDVVVEQHMPQAAAMIFLVARLVGYKVSLANLGLHTAHTFG